jgi:hypothetical protein
LKDQSSIKSIGLRLVIGIILLLGFVFSNFIWPWWPPNWIERREQREIVTARVQSAGGWDAIRQGCISLAVQNTNGFFSHLPDTNRLPPSIAALAPSYIEYLPERGCVRLTIFGMHRTGGHSTPYFALEVDTSSKSLEHIPGSGYSGGGVIGNYYSTYRQIADGVYEVY